MFKEDLEDNRHLLLDIMTIESVNEKLAKLNIRYEVFATIQKQCNTSYITTVKYINKEYTGIFHNLPDCINYINNYIPQEYKDINRINYALYKTYTIKLEDLRLSDFNINLSEFRDSKFFKDVENKLKYFESFSKKDKKDLLYIYQASLNMIKEDIFRQLKDKEELHGLYKMLNNVCI